MKHELPEKHFLPHHVAVIMDGNGRWAMERGLPRLDGHARGADVVRDITTFTREIGIPYLTLYSFSVQNWRRPPSEIAGLMTLLEDYCRDELSTLMENDIRLSSIGRLDRIPRSTRRALESVMEKTAHNRAMTLTLAVDYGGREELLSAIKKIAEDVKTGVLNPGAVDEATLEARLQTALLPDPDLVIRTSGEMRVSNFLLWQVAYAEFTFTDVRWPDFTREDFSQALRTYAERERRFGGTKPATSVDSTPDVENEGFVLGDMQNVPLEKDTGPC